MSDLTPAQRLPQPAPTPRFARWAATHPVTPHAETGCVQCGSSLERPRHNHSGKCFNCAEWISDDDEEFGEFE